MFGSREVREQGGMFFYVFYVLNDSQLDLQHNIAK